MTETDLVSPARRLAERHHAGQVDKAGAPYIGHILRVADRVSHLDSEAIAAGLLHDVLEDTAATEDELAAAGIPATVIEAVVLLTKTGGPLADYYARIRNNPIALAVKLADIADNNDPSRQALLAPEVRQRLQRKYAQATAALTH